MSAFHAIAAAGIWAAVVSAAACAQTFDARARKAVIIGAAELIETRYVNPEKGKAIARELRRDAERDATPESDPAKFAQAFQARLRTISNDGHFAVDYHANTAPTAGEAVDKAREAAEMERWYGAAVNHGFESVQRLEGGIGYLDLRVFAPADMGADLAVAAMSLLAQSPALIIDLRHNGGGVGDMVNLLEAYLLAGPTEVSGAYDRPSGKLTRSFTPAWAPGRRFGPDKPVFILTSRRTFSAAEAFAYDLQAMKRATIVGERTGGGAHPFKYRAIDEHFVLSLPESRSINPITGKNWEGTGVAPDVETPADQALARALDLAKAAIAGQAVPPLQ